MHIFWVVVDPLTPESRTPSEKTADRECSERETLSFSALRVSAHVGRQSHHLKLKTPRKMLPASHDNKNNHRGSEQRSQDLSTLRARCIRYLSQKQSYAHNIFDVYQRSKNKTGALQQKLRQFRAFRYICYVTQNI